MTYHDTVGTNGIEGTAKVGPELGASFTAEHSSSKVADSTFLGTAGPDGRRRPTRF